MVDCFEIELTNSQGKKRRLGFCFLSEAEAKLWIKQHPVSKDESYRIVPFEKYEVRKSTNILEE